MCIYPVYTLTFVISLNWFIIDNVQCAGTSIQCHKQSLCFVCNKIEKKRYKLLKVVKALMFSCFNLKILRWHINVKWPILMSFISFGDVGGNIGHRVCLYSVHTHTHTYAPRVIIEDKWSTAPRRHVCIGSSNLVASTAAFLSLSLSLSNISLSVRGKVSIVWHVHHSALAIIVNIGDGQKQQLGHIWSTIVKSL